MITARTVQGLIEHKNCRSCGHKELESIISLGDQCLTNFIDSPDQTVNKAPLELILCNRKNGGCGLLQLKHTVPGDILFRQFWYKSGVNQTMRDALEDVVSKTKEIVHLNPGDIVIDIGANDGTLLRCYNINGLRLIGFEPAVNLIKEAEVGTTKIINDFFGYEAFQKEFDGQKAKIITSIAMFYDLEDPNIFVKDTARILEDDGVWVIQMNYLTTMLENNAFDNIMHEHLEYYSLIALEHLLNKHGLEVFDLELNDVNGGSIRTYIKHKKCDKYTVKQAVIKTREHEEHIGLDDHAPYYQFAKRIDELRMKTHSFIKSEVQNGKTVYVYGASSRGNTLLQFYNLDHTLIKAAVERNPTKWGKKTVGTLIPIISEEQARKDRPDYFLVLPWYFLDEFKQREEAYLKNGGKFIVPLPNFVIIQS